MPRKPYKTITVKVAIFDSFVEAVKEAKMINPDIDNSRFLAYLLHLYYKASDADEEEVIGQD